MKSASRTLWVLSFVILLAAPTTTSVGSSAPAGCPELVREALTTTDQLCEGTSRDQACYGHISVQARSQPGIDHLVFDQAGDIVNVEDVRALRVSAMSVDANVWGIALMRLKASLPDTLASQNITLLLFGDVQIENAMTPSARADVTVEATRNVNVRQKPSLDALVVDALAPGQTATATGRLADGSWIRVELPDTGGTGWVHRSLLADTGNIDALDVVEASSRYYGPMQAVYFRSGMNDAACPEAPDSGLLVQTPEGVAKVTLLINEVDIQLGSTVYFQAQPGDQMIVRVVEGSARVEALGVASTARAGMQISVPLNEDMTPSGPPSPPTAYDMAFVEALPVDHLVREVTIHPPATQEEIAEATQVPAVVPAVSSSEQDGNNSDFPPGLIDNPGLTDNPALDGGLPPGQGGTSPGQDGSLPPGQGSTPPGQDKTKDKDK
jgi:hypothetical protein